MYLKDEKKNKYLKAENKLLRENLKRMSDNVNVLIEKMNQESLKKKRIGGNTRTRAGGDGDDIGQSVAGHSSSKSPRRGTSINRG